MMRIALILASALAVSACGGSKLTDEAPAFIPAPGQKVATGLAGVMGNDARGLVRMFGAARLDVREGSGRKLQFSGSTCVLDTYLYPPKTGKEPVVTFVSARVPDGRDADKGSCVSALQKR
jgi:hypothetical protein